MQKENARERIVQACLELLKTTSLEALRTQDLMEKAKVSRSTFYRLFPDKFAVVNWVYWYETEKVIREFPKLSDWKEWTVVLHGYIRKHKRFFRNIASYRGQNSFGEFLCRYFTDNTISYRANRDQPVTEDERYGIWAFSLVASEATINWILDDCRTDDETIIRRQELCIPEFIRHLYR